MHHIIRVIGLKTHYDIIVQLASALEQFVNNSIEDVTEPPTEQCSTKYKGSHNFSVKINAAIYELKKKYNTII